MGPQDTRQSWLTTQQTAPDHLDGVLRVEQVAAEREQALVQQELGDPGCRPLPASREGHGARARQDRVWGKAEMLMTMVGMKLFSRAAVRESSGSESEWRERHCHEQMMRTVWRASSTADSLESNS